MKKTKKIKIILNGKSRSLQKTTSVHDLMRSLKLPTDKVAIELNKEIINKIKLDQSNFPLHSQLMETIEEFKILKFLNGI